MLKNSKHPLYQTWYAMVRRCTRPTHEAYPRYGGRGILVSPEWAASFETFLQDMGPRPPGTTLDRKDNSGPYCKDNCRWATRKQQAQNSRSSVMVTLWDTTQCISDWCAQLGLKSGTISSRIARGATPEYAILASFVVHRTGRRINEGHMARRAAQEAYLRANGLD